MATDAISVPRRPKSCAFLYVHVYHKFGCDARLGTDVSSMLARASALAGGHRATFDALDEPQATLTSRGARRPVSRPAAGAFVALAQGVRARRERMQ